MSQKKQQEENLENYQDNININNEILKNENNEQSDNNKIDNSINNNNIQNERLSKTSIRLSLSNYSQLEIPISHFNPSQFSFKPKSNESFVSPNKNNVNSFEQYITPQKHENKNSFEKMLTVEKLRNALAPLPLTETKKDIFHCKTDAKRFPKYPEFKKITFDDLPDLEIMILDDVDKKSFAIYEKINYPDIEELSEIMKNKNIKEEDFDYFASISYLLFMKRNEFLPEQRQLILKNIPFYTLNSLISDNQSESFNNNSIFYLSSSPDNSFTFPLECVNTLCMILNIIIFCVQSEEDIKMFIEYYGKDEVYYFIDNMCFLLENINIFRLQRKILALFVDFFRYNDEIILNFFRKVEKIIDINNISTNIVIKLQQIMKNKQKKYINLILENKDKIEEKLKNNEIDKICYIIQFLTFILSGAQGNFIFEEKIYVSFLKYFRELNIKNQKIDENLFQLKIRIKRLI